MSDAPKRAARIAREDDLTEILRLYRQLQPSDPPLSDETATETFSAILAGPGTTIMVLDGTHGLVATAYLNVMPNLTRAAAPYAVVENVVVDEAVRGTGLGKEIMAATLDAAWAAGCYKVMLLTGSKRASTHAFYRACGLDPDEKTAYIAHP